MGGANQKKDRDGAVSSWLGSELNLDNTPLHPNRYKYRTNYRRTQSLIAFGRGTRKQKDQRNKRLDDALDQVKQEWANQPKEFLKRWKESWYVEFTTGGELMNNTNDHKALQVLSTLGDCMIDFVRATNPKYIVTVPIDSKRERVYKAMFKKKLIPEGYKFGTSYEGELVLVRK